MIKYNLKELIAKKEFEDQKKISISELSEILNISRATLSRIANSKGNYSTKTEYIDKLCQYFSCACDELMTIIPDKKE